MNTLLNRRGFLGTLAAGALTACAPLSTGNRPAQPMVVDTHLHCFGGSKDLRFPYHERAPYQPDESATPGFLLKCMDGAGVDRAIVVHPEPYQDDHRYLEHCLNVGQGRLKGTCLFFADRPGSIERLPDLVKRLPIVAARVHAYVADRLPPFGSPELHRLWQMATDLGLAMQLHFEPRFALGFEPYIREFKNTRVILDHLGRPFQGTPDEHARIVAWAKYPNTVMKLSAIPPEVRYPHRDIRPVMRTLVEAWGADRLIYGGGFGASATPESYRGTREFTASLIDGLSAADQAKVLGGKCGRGSSVSDVRGRDAFSLLLQRRYRVSAWVVSTHRPTAGPPPPPDTAAESRYPALHGGSNPSHPLGVTLHVTGTRVVPRSVRGAG